MLTVTLPPPLVAAFYIPVHCESSDDYTSILYTQRLPCGILQSLGTYADRFLPSSVLSEKIQYMHYHKDSLCD